MVSLVAQKANEQNRTWFRVRPNSCLLLHSSRLDLVFPIPAMLSITFFFRKCTHTQIGNNCALPKSWRSSISIRHLFYLHFYQSWTFIWRRGEGTIMNKREDIYWGENSRVCPSRPMSTLCLGWDVHPIRGGRSVITDNLVLYFCLF
jgi:hypothetical protein